MLLQGVHPKVVSERLWHASVGITLDTYSHVIPAMQAEAARAFDELFGPGWSHARRVGIGPPLPDRRLALESPRRGAADRDRRDDRRAGLLV